MTVHDVTYALEQAGLRYQIKGRYIVTQCPLHQDRHASCQIFLDDFFASCLAGCGRYHISKAFPELREGRSQTIDNYHTTQRRDKEAHHYISTDSTDKWTRLPLIPRTHTFKNLPLEVLDEMGWRYDSGSYFIPYWNRTRTKIPFVQWRHLSGSRRFTFLAGAKPTLYGKWNISPGARLFITEGTSDCAVLERCGVPWVGLPSASSGSVLANFVTHTRQLKCTFVYAGDNDAAGDKLRETLDETGVPYRVCQPPTGFKDWGDFYEKEGDLAVFDRCREKLFE